MQNIRSHDKTLHSSMASGVTCSRQSPQSFTTPRWVTSRACGQQVRLWLLDFTVRSLRELMSGPLALCHYSWLIPLSGSSWGHVLPLSKPHSRMKSQCEHWPDWSSLSQHWGVLSFWSGVWLTPASVWFRLYLFTCMRMKACVRCKHNEN